MVGVNVVVADSDEQAAFLFTSILQRFLGMQRGQRGPLPRPVDPAQMEAMWNERERAAVLGMLAASACGGPARVKDELDAILAATRADELIVAGALHDHHARLRSYELLSGIALASPPPA
jgi:alkanesulfonate monooxygenase SsuD/methylene tetrahydromethanopterin reductase-like flavin-dependent oxidoreductase (luciferase family)